MSKYVSIQSFKEMRGKYFSEVYPFIWIQLINCKNSINSKIFTLLAVNLKNFQLQALYFKYKSQLFEDFHIHYKITKKALRLATSFTFEKASLKIKTSKML